ncbi:MAG TPA: radical SAM protein [Polyangiaceae bacterium]|jgi:MoaA/NifB/PqqE/SkfB family radical SAM enzyme
MTRKLPLLARLAGYRVAHATGAGPRQLPVNLTVSVTYSCPSRCVTCDIWKKKVDDLSVDEYGRIFPTLQRVPIWVTVSGGDQFVRGDLDEIVRLIRVQIEPRIVNIPMNGVITERIFDLLPKIVHHTLGSQLVLNLSVDEIGEAHDRIRGAERNFEKLRLVADLVHDLQKTYDHVVLGVHTVISRANVQRVPEIEREARAIFRPDSYIAEVAENRVELDTMAKDITPDVADYRRAVRHLGQVIRASRSTHPVARLVESLRLEYYELAARILEEKRQVIECYAGLASAHLAPDGHVWGCCVRAESMGNVRDHGYDFGAVWKGAQADAFRRSVKAHECSCPLANASYTNLLLDAPSLARVTASMVGIGS